jgi:methyl-accepting chemotaxis protein
MSKTITPDATADGAVDYEEAINRMLSEMKQANEKMDGDQEEIERLKAETREILARLKAA